MGLSHPLGAVGAALVFGWTGLAGAALVFGGAAAPDVGAEDPGAVVRYSRDIRPLLSDRCFLCHGPDAGAVEAGLRLDTFEHATADRGGYAAVAPGDVEGSELWYRVNAEHDAERMPPPEAHREALGPDELDLVRRWIEAGASYEEHWAFASLTRPELPEVEGVGGATHPVDAFVRARLAEAGIEPAPEERPDLLLRRLFLDLTGLPPTPEELDAFLVEYVEGDRDAVWETWVDRLLTEEPYRSRYAERMASPWLDQARYADTNGIHMDAGRQIWPWRDWVLRAYRENMPFDRFLTEQLAGDLLPDATIDQVVASGFNRNHVITDEGGAIDEEYLVEYAVDRVDTTSKVFLGLTVSCARCHDHKFDPVSQEDYYRFFAFFNSIDEPGLYSQEPDPERAFAPMLEVPEPEQVARRAELADELEAVLAARDAMSPEDRAAFEAWRAGLAGELDLAWAAAEVVDSGSSEGTTFEPLADGSLLAAGPVPATDVHRFTLRTDETDLRLLQLDALGHESLANGAPGRAGNGNAVLTSIAIEAVSVADPTQRQPVELAWAWADHAQDNDDYGVLRALDPRENTGWAIAGHTDGSERSALFLAAEPFGYEGGTDVVVTLGYESIWSGHSFGRVRLGLAGLGDDALAALPLSGGAWYQAGPFALESAAGAYDAEFGPASDTTLDPTASFGSETGPAQRWTYRREFADAQVTALPAGVNVTYLGKEIWSPEERAVEVSLGSDDGFALYVNGAEVAASDVARGVAADQDRAVLPLREGRNSVVLKVVNTGGQAGFYFAALEAEEVLREGLVAALLDPAARADAAPDHEPRATAALPPLGERVLHGWRMTRSEEYAANLAREAELAAARAKLEAAIPRTMVMRELPEPRPAFVLSRGEYDKADPERPVAPGVPRFLEGFGPALQGGDERATRLDLARWMTAPDNPLVSRVAVNRIWQLIFGRGLVATSGDFGHQGSWPSHPELLDRLASDFVASGWDVQGLIRRIVTSDTYRQSSRVRPEVAAIDPDGALLASYPRRRLDAEAIRDQALYTAGLLVEQLGGPSVKPYQPPGLWQEIAMLQSNTRTFERGMGADLWRRSVYTYWKRAAPPPALMIFDAPTRESCVIGRTTTTTPLQALVLWNDEQFVEAARVLAERSLRESGGDDRAGLARMFRRCTGREPDERELAILESTLAEHRARYAESPEDARALLDVGEAELAEDGPPAPELAAWTLVASTVLNLHATLTRG